MPELSHEEMERMLRPTWLDKAIGRVAPGWGAARLQKRRAFTYEAARNTRLRNSAARLQGPEDFSAFPDRLQLIRQMRDMVQNFGLFQAIQDKLAMYAFGQIRYQALTGDKATNDIYEQRLTARFQNIDLSGRHNLRQLTGIAFKSSMTDGDFFLKWQRYQGDLYLTGVEGDRVGGIIMGSPLNNYFQGIVIDPETGRAQSVRIYDRTKANSYVNPVDVPAADVIQHYDPRRIDQYRGVTPFAPIINEARDLKELMEAVRIGTKFENYHSAIGYTGSGLPLDDPATFIQNGDAVNALGQQLPQQEIQYGKIQWAPTNSKVEFLKSDRPSGQFQAYLDNLIRLIGNALGLPYGFIYNLLGLSGPSARMDAQQAHRVIQWHQQNMVERVLDRVKNTLILEDIGAGVLPYSARWMRGKWQFAPAITIDAGRDSKAMIEEWKNGLRTKESIYSEDGYDAEEQEAIILDEAERTLDRAIKISEDKGVPLELALTLLEVRTPNGWVPRAAPEQDISPAGKVTQIGGPAAKPSGGSAFAYEKIVRELAAKRPRLLRN